jgi:hypothetical protein
MAGHLIPVVVASVHAIGAALGVAPSAVEGMLAGFRRTPAATAAARCDIYCTILIT